MDQTTRRGSSRARPASDVAPSRAGRLAGGLVVCVLFMGSTLLTPLYDLYRQAYGFSALTLVLLYAVYVVGNLAALLLLGRLSDQLGRRPVALAGLALAGLSTGLFLVAQAPWALFAGRMLSGCAVGLGAGAATAWITEFTPAAERAGSASVMTAFNFIGLTLGPVLAGVLVQYAAWPLRLSFLAYLAVLALTAAGVAATAETLRRRRGARPDLKPRLGLPPGAGLAFIAPGATGFAAMALVGFYAALGPTMIREALHVTNRALSGVVVSELFLVAAVVILATRDVRARTAMTWGLILTPPGLALLIAAQQLGSMPVMLAGTTLCGVASALSYRGGLAVANGLAPAERRAEVASAYFVCCFLGNALPIIGVGALTQATGPRLADMAFAGLVSAIALAALAAGLAFRVRPGRAPA